MLDIFYKLLFTLLLSYSTSLFAGEVEESVKQAMEFYKAGQKTEAITQLEYAAQLIRQQRGEGLKLFLPKALSGWSAGEAESQSAGASMFGGGTSVSKNYTKDSVSVTVNIATDSPLLQSVMMMLANPMIFQAQGAKLKMVNGQQVMLSEDGAVAVVNNSIVVQVNGDSEPDILAYTNAIDFPGIAKFK